MRHLLVALGLDQPLRRVDERVATKRVGGVVASPRHLAPINKPTVGLIIPRRAARRTARRVRRLPGCDRPTFAASSSWPRASSAPTTPRRPTGVIRYGRDDVVAVIDSTAPGRTSSTTCPATTSRSSRPSPTHSPCRAAPDALLIGIAPTGGRLPAPWRTRSSRRHRGRARGPVRASHLPRRRPGVRGGRQARGDVDRRLPAAARADGDGRRPPPRPGKARDPHGRQRLRDRQDVGRARAARAAVAAGDRAVVRPDRPDRDDDRGLGGRGRPAHQRLRPGHRRVAGRAGRGARRLGHRRGPGLAGPPGLLVGDARRSSTARRRTRWSWSTSRAWPSTTSTTCPRRRSRSPTLPEFIDLHERVPGSSRRRRSSRSRSTRRSTADEAEARRVIEEIAAETGLPTDDPFRFGADLLWSAIRAAVDALPRVGR